MNGNLLSTIYGTLFNPSETFKNIKEQQDPPIFAAFLVVILVSIIGCINDFNINSILALVLSIISYVIFALISWVFIAAIIDALASVFSKTRAFDTLLVLTAFSLLPWILIGPIGLFKSFGVDGIGVIGYLFAIILGIAIWIWTVLLFLFAVSKTYDLNGGKTILLALMPFLGGIIAFFWLAGFIANLISIVNT